MKIVQSKRFTEELHRIVWHIRDDKPSAARTFALQLKKKINLLTDSPINTDDLSILITMH